MRLLRQKRAQETKPPSSPLHAVVGLRNPGPGYEGTRHNIGYEVVATLLDRAGTELGRGPSRLGSMTAQTGVGDERCLFVVPNVFMNESGGPVRATLDYYKVPVGAMLVVHDDIDLPFGRFRVQVGGGSGGHNGIRSLEKGLGGAGFTRLKFGVGRPPGSMDPADHVLRRFTGDERPEVDVMVEEAADIVSMWLSDPPRAQELAALRGKEG